MKTPLFDNPLVANLAIIGALAFGATTLAGGAFHILDVQNGQTETAVSAAMAKLEVPKAYELTSSVVKADRDDCGVFSHCPLLSNTYSVPSNVTPKDFEKFLVSATPELQQYRDACEPVRGDEAFTCEAWAVEEPLQYNVSYTDSPKTGDASELKIEIVSWVDSAPVVY